MGLVEGCVFRGRPGACALLFFAASIRLTIAQGSAVNANHQGTIHPFRTALRPGLSSFVIAIPKEKERTITILNQNLTAEGRFSIAVSDRQLPAGSPQWKAVRGTIRFRKQKQFAVSLDGIEAEYVRLTFEVRPLPGSAKLK